MNDTSRLLSSDIVFWGERVAAHTEGLTEQQFLNDDLAADVVCWCLRCIGEAAGALYRSNATLRSFDPALDLVKAYGMRNRLAHDYGGIDLGVVWQAATVSVPAMVLAARQVIQRGT
ncbi:HepT-like ribonuclease domain-containing protein [Chelativorans sp.]|uniref:HepT-like ribonuclease domain-containing protein n=1 Tax=Chelativorans sp. TaxID=2203393 RepID=UPI002811EF52|nr:HepT-like ribonuclease domain-containing protein [Chelativorans sp.]